MSNDCFVFGYKYKFLFIIVLICEIIIPFREQIICSYYLVWIKETVENE